MKSADMRLDVTTALGLGQPAEVEEAAHCQNFAGMRAAHWQNIVDWIDRTSQDQSGSVFSMSAISPDIDRAARQ